MMRIKTAMILAAGRGERLRPLTDHTPKPLLPIGGGAMIVRLLRQLQQAGIEQVVINICYLAEQFIDALGDGSALGLNIHWSRESALLGAGGSLLNARVLLGNNPFVLVSGDVVADYDFTRLTTYDLQGRLLQAVLVKDARHTGDWGLHEGLLCLQAMPKYTFAAMALIDPALLQAHEVAFMTITELFKPAIVAGLAGGELFTGCYHNVGTLADYRLANEEVTHA